MPPRLIFDAHLDLSYNAVDYNRDLRWPLERIRRHEIGKKDHSFRSRGTLCFPEMRRGRIGLCVATQLARYVDRFSRMPGWNSPEQAWAWTQGQHAWHVEMERCGELLQLRTGPAVAAHAARWQEADDAEASQLPIGYVLSLEGADSIVSWRHLETAFGYGLRIIGLTHYGPGIYGQGTDAIGPLTPRGRELLGEMRRLGMILDATHLCDESFRDALDHWDGPVWASHSNCRALASWNRQLTDDQIRELARRGAVIGMAFDAIMMVQGWAHHRSRPEDFQLRIEKIVEHMDHICQLTGSAKHVAIGSDLDGGFGTEQTPTDLDTIADLGRLQEILTRRGYAPGDVDAILHGNAVAFLSRHLPAA
ncbi:MAG: membrane dipeptidase [Verrucomicrobiae bacterium]|nr:membrane dipeptidase [Verrucomicrobiae bacterium]